MSKCYQAEPINRGKEDLLQSKGSYSLKKKLIEPDRQLLVCLIHEPVQRLLPRCQDNDSGHAEARSMDYKPCLFYKSQNRQCHNFQRKNPMRYVAQTNLSKSENPCLHRKHNYSGSREHSKQLNVLKFSISELYYFGNQWSRLKSSISISNYLRFAILAIFFYCTNLTTVDAARRSIIRRFSAPHDLNRVNPMMPEYLAHPIMLNHNNTKSKWLYPSVVNLASQARITTNATCGENRPEIYCKLVEHVFRRSNRRGQQCGICYEESPLLSQRHEITHAIDGRGNTWWQSPSIDQGYKYYWVTLTLDLKQMFQVAYIIIKAGNSPRPGNWILERSIDGIVWNPWQYFAISNSECYRAYGIQATGGAPDYKSDNQVMCTSYFSQIIPFENGELFVSLINGRPSAENPSPELVEFTSARYIRLRLQKIRTLHGDLMTISSHGDNDPTVTRRYYYTIKDISIGGMCICYGHASTCPANAFNGLFTCACEHNTAGHNCERCKSGFNQLQWKPGNDNFQCEECNCNGHSDECFFDSEIAEKRVSINIHGEYEGGGVCVGCKDLTEGINCQTCKDGYYRPLNVEPSDYFPCVQCDCDSRGGTRVADSSELHTCVKDVSFVDIDRDLYPGSCYCKIGYIGQRCDRCAFGYRGFPNCEPCSCNVAGSLNADPCFGDCICKENVSGARCSRCKNGFYNLQTSNTFGCEECYCFGVTNTCTSSNLRWSTIQTNQGWEVKDRHGRRNSRAQFDFDLQEPFVEHGQVARDLGTTVYYWTAPSLYLGKRLDSYGGTLRYIVSYDITRGSQAFLIQDADVILEGHGKTLLYNYRGSLVEPQYEHEVVLKLAPSLTAGDYGWVEATTLQPINKADMMMVLNDVTRILIRAVYSRNSEAVYRIRDVYLETASSQGQGIMATSVEQCFCPYGYTGKSCEICLESHWRNGDRCLKCDCNGHSSKCNKLNGECQNCEDNAMGMHCEKCKPGFYGDATWGSPDDCQRCTCPLSISSNNFSPSCKMDLQTKYLICLECPPEYAGKTCEFCADGFHGDPTSPGGMCQPCNCHGNSGTCDRHTGVCFNCEGFTAGVNCERCQVAYFGDATARKDCQQCNCHPIGSLSRLCDPITGQCTCKRGVHGRQCDVCANGDYLSLEARMCVSCDCDATGSVTSQCRADGTCLCKMGVEGDLCDKCQNGFYGLSASGCSVCDCVHTNGNCDHVTGACMCPPNTGGIACSQCLPGFYYWNAVSGCKKCDCNTIGSTSNVCHSVAGQCPCKSSYTGLQCSQCRNGYYGFPNCRSCKCSTIGTEGSTCQNDGLCECASNGNCLCKANVVGQHCDQCATGSFGLANHIAFGCTACYCSDVTDQCTQSDYVWGLPISLKSHPVEVLNEMNFNNGGTVPTDSFVTLNSRFSRRSIRSEPYYWRLPPQFNGDKMLSYGGNLSYTIYYVSALPSSGDTGASVMIRGGDIITQTIQYHVTDPHIGSSRSYVVPMQEYGWTHVDNGRKVSRFDFAKVLQKIDFFLIKASYGTLLDQTRLSSVYLDVAKPYSGGRGDNADPIEYPLAIGIEKCICPSGYTGLSCQDCMEGYMRIQEGINFGKCEPCNCHNRSDACDIATGKCLNCEDKFIGHYCETCIPGYYLNGNQCFKCECPGSDVVNNFSPTCVPDGGSYVCDDCAIGYTGRHCGSCANGYFGNPTIPGGYCAKCGCNLTGSRDGVCNKITGQCWCEDGIRGRICDQCEEKHVITEDGCSACNDGCSGLLLNDLEEMSNKVLRVNISNMFPAPWHRFLAAQNLTIELQPYIELLLHRKLNYLVDKWLTVKTNLDIASHDTMEGIENIMFIPENLTNLDRRIGPLLAESITCDLDASDLMSSTQLSSERIKTDKEKARYLLNTIEGTSKKSSRLLHQLMNNSADDVLNMQDVIAGVVDGVRNTDMELYQNIASMELEKAQNLSKFVHVEFTKRIVAEMVKLNSSEMVIQSKVDDFRKKMNSFDKIIADATLVMEVADQMNSLNNQTLHQVTGIIEKYNNEAIIVIVKLKEAQGLITEAKDLFDNGTTYKEQLGLLSEALNKNRTNLQETFDSTYIHKSITELSMKTQRVLYHRSELQSNADYLASVERNISEFSYNQTEAASRWTKIANTLDKANKTAHKAVMVSMDALSMATTDLVESTEASFRNSQHVLQDVQTLNNTVTGARDRLKYQKEFLRYEKQNTKNLSLLRDKAVEKIKKIKKFKSPPTVETNRVVESTKKLVNKLKKKLSIAQRNARKLEEAQLNTKRHQEIVQDVESNLKSLPESLNEAETSQQKAVQSQARVKLSSDSVRDDIMNVRKLIEEVKRKAASIRRVSVSSNGRCAMRYKPRITSGKTTEITLNVMTNSPNNMLFYLARNKKDYIAVELRSHKVWVTWDLGGGPGLVQNPVLVKSDMSEDVGFADWFIVNINRQNQEVNVTVYRASDKDNTVQTTSSKSSGLFSTLNINSDDVLYVGGLLNTTQVPDAVVYRTFTGCMGEAFLQGKSIGLWNFEEISNADDCQSCIESEVMNKEEQQSNTYSYNGHSYSVLPLPLAFQPAHNQFSIRFQTFSSQGLLLYIGAMNLPDFISLELNDGKLMMKIDLGSGIYTNETIETYNTGNWVQVNVIRHKEDALMTLQRPGFVDERVWVNATNSDAKLDFNLNDTVCVGGFPTERRIKANVTRTSFVGCLKDFNFAHTLLSLKSTGIGDVVMDSGISATCPAQVTRDIGIAVDGFVQLPPISFPATASISMTFNTREPDAVLLLAIDDAKRRRRRRKRQSSKNFYSLYLSDGNVGASIYAGKGSILNLTSSKNIYSNGRTNTITLKRNGSRIMLIINENSEEIVGTLPNGNTSPIRTNCLYVGGLPENVNVGQAVKTRNSINGCIRDLLINSLINFKTSIFARNSHLGTCEFVNFAPAPTTSAASDGMSANPLKTPQSTQAEEDTLNDGHMVTARPPMVDEAVCKPVGNIQTIQNFSAHFGLTNHSHVQFQLPLKFNNKFSFDVKVRTYSKNGLLLYAGQKDFFALKVKEGVPLFQFDNGAGVAEISATVPINNGQWHKIRVKRSKRRGWLTVDGNKQKVTANKGATQMDVSPELYVGGLPHGYNTDVVGTISKSMDICMKDLVLNKRTRLNLSTPTSFTNVEKCYKRIERGAYFMGSGYVKYRNKYRVGPNILIELEFRTWSANGIILSVDGAVDGLALELVNGSIFFRTNNGRGAFEISYPQISTSPPKKQRKFPLCNGKWHTIVAEKFKRTLSLIVDGYRVGDVISHVMGDSADTNDPLYIGGLPDTAPHQKQLRTNRNFKGCIRNLRLKKSPILFDDPSPYILNKGFQTVDIYPGSCPKSLNNIHRY